jgi:hypothetical protein
MQKDLSECFQQGESSPLLVFLKKHKVPPESLFLISFLYWLFCPFPFLFESDYLAKLFKIQK